MNEKKILISAQLTEIWVCEITRMMDVDYSPLFLLNNSGFLRISRPLKAENIYLLLKWRERFLYYS